MSELILIRQVEPRAGRLLWIAAKFAERLTGYTVLVAYGVIFALVGWGCAQQTDAWLLAHVGNLVGDANATAMRRTYLLMLGVGPAMTFFAVHKIVECWRELMASPARAAFFQGVAVLGFVLWVTFRLWSGPDEDLPPPSPGISQEMLSDFAAATDRKI